MKIKLPQDLRIRAMIDVAELIEITKNPPQWRDAIAGARKFLRAEPAAKSVNVFASLDGELILGEVTRRTWRILWYFEHGTAEPPTLPENWD